jgi:hypothetical protein
MTGREREAHRCAGKTFSPSPVQGRDALCVLSFSFQIIDKQILMDVGNLSLPSFHAAVGLIDFHNETTFSFSMSEHSKRFMTADRARHSVETRRKVRETGTMKRL